MMVQRALGLCVLLFAIVCFTMRTEAAAPCAASRFALVIGNQSYPDSDAGLTEPIGNARRVAETARRLGFETTLGTDLTKVTMQAAFDTLRDKVGDRSVVFLFFSGFGVQSGNHTYLIPTDAAIWSEQDVRTYGVNLDRVIAAMEAKGAGAQIVVIDAARRNPFERRFRLAGSAGLAAVSGANNLIAFYSTVPNAVFDPLDGVTSPFVDHLVTAMEAGGATAEAAFQTTRSDIARVSRAGQRPWISSSLSGDLVLGRPDCAAAPAKRDEPAGAKPEVSAAMPMPPEESAPPARAVVAPDHPPMPAPREFETALDDTALLAETRERLYEQDFDPGPVGSPAMEDAIRKFEKQAGLPSVGRPTQGLLRSLREADTLKPWGAITVARDVTHWGMSWGAPTRRQALAEAKTRCGTDLCTRAVSFFGNQCGAFALSQQSWSMTWRSNGAVSRQAALDECAARGPPCRLFGAVCADGSEKAN